VSVVPRRVSRLGPHAWPPTSVTDTGELRAVFDRVADIAQKVLPSDAMAVPVLTADQEREFQRTRRIEP
jgi:hypothetical protein